VWQGSHKRKQHILRLVKVKLQIVLILELIRRRRGNTNVPSINRDMLSGIVPGIQRIQPL
jgi:hypothetical protein